MKQLITREPVLRYFDNTREVKLQCDASDSGLGAVIMQEGQPVAFSSRALTNTEKNYAQIEKELLSTVHSCIRFDQYVYGRELNYCPNRSQALGEHFEETTTSSSLETSTNVTPVTEVPLECGVQTRKGTYLSNEPAPEKNNCDVFAVRQEQYLIKCMEEIDMVDFLPITAKRLAG